MNATASASSLVNEQLRETMTNKELAIQDALHHPWTWCYRGKVKVRFIPEQNKLEVKEAS